jgi:hypothetical protein
MAARAAAARAERRRRTARGGESAGEATRWRTGEGGRRERRRTIARGDRRRARVARGARRWMTGWRCRATSRTTRVVTYDARGGEGRVATDGEGGEDGGTRRRRVAWWRLIRSVAGVFESTTTEMKQWSGAHAIYIFGTLVPVDLTNRS